MEIAVNHAQWKQLRLKVISFYAVMVLCHLYKMSASGRNFESFFSFSNNLFIISERHLRLQQMLSLNLYRLKIETFEEEQISMHEFSPSNPK